MNEKLSESRLGKIKKKLAASDRVVYIISSALIEEDAASDMKLMTAELSRCWKEIRELNESVRLLSKKAISFQNTGHIID